VERVFRPNHKVVIITSLLLLVVGLLGLLRDRSGANALLTDGSSAVNMVGQYDIAGDLYYTKGGTNNGPNNVGFDGADGVAVDEVDHRLFVTDSSNHRVLVYNLNVTTNVLDDYEADYVLGQADFYSADNSPTSSTLYYPSDLDYDSTNKLLYVADTLNNRVAVFDVTSITNGEAVAYALGQSNTSNNSSATTQAGMSRPTDIAYDSVNEILYVADLLNHRVLSYDVSTLTTGENAANVLGQVDFVTKTTGLTQSTMNRPQNLDIDPVNNYLYVVDDSNNRVLVYDVTPNDAGCGAPNDGICDGENAYKVLVQSDFTSNSTSTLDPYAVEYDETNDRLYVSHWTDGIKVFDSVSTAAETGTNPNTTIADGTTGQSGLNYSTAIAVDEGADLMYTVADNNRVLVFDVDTVTPEEDAVNVVGQLNESDTPVYTKNGANNGPNSSSFGKPVAMVVDTVNHRLFVTDRGNNRVLVFNLDASDELVDYNADYVLGQSDIYSDSSSCTSTTLNSPNGLYYDDSIPGTERLFVHDSSNARVMVFDVTSISTGEAAVNVLGQADFTSCTGGTTANMLMSVPYYNDITFDTGRSHLYVTDGPNHRVMIFNITIDDSNCATPNDGICDGEDAINVLGQADFVSNSPATTQTGLDANSNVGVVFDNVNDRLFIAEDDNNRVVVHDFGGGAPLSNGRGADYVLGQADFTSSDSATTQAGMNSPVSVEYDEDDDRLFVTEYYGARVVIHNFGFSAISNGDDADNVLGPSQWWGYAWSGTDTEKMSFPMSAHFVETSNRLFVADGNNYRLMIYDAEAPAQASVSVNSAVQATDGTGYVSISVDVDDTADSDTKLKVEYESDSDGSCDGPWSAATLIGTEATADFDDSGGAPDIDNLETYQVGTTATTRIITSSGANTITFSWDSATDLSSANETNCLRFTANNDSIDGTPTTETLALDNVAPTGLGSLVVDTYSPTTMDFDWSVASDDNFANYEIWYGSSQTAVQNRVESINWSAGTQLRSMGSSDTAVGVFVFDVNQDGNEDIIATDMSDGVYFYESDGVGGFTENPVDEVMSGAYDVWVEDINEDGYYDILAAAGWSDEIVWYENDGSENFTRHQIDGSLDYATIVTAGDLDEDGDIDVVGGNIGSDDEFAIYWNDGSENFTKEQLATSNGSARDAYLADVDSDGDLDIFTVEQNSPDSFKLWTNDGTGSFTSEGIDTGALNTIHVDDIDGDGDMDVALTNMGAFTIDWYENTDGLGSYTENSGALSGLSSTRGAHIVDLDGDGDMDLMASGQTEEVIVWGENDGSENFTKRTVVSGHKTADGDVIGTGDFDGDGDIDVVAGTTWSTSGADEIRWWANSGTAAEWDDSNDVDLATSTTASTTITGLIINTEYYYKLFAVDDLGNYQTLADDAMYTTINDAGEGTLTATGPNSLNYVINTNSNPVDVEYTITDIDGSRYVQIDGSLDDPYTVQTYAEWGGALGQSIIGLSSNTEYNFAAMGRNGDDINSGQSDTSTLVTLADQVTSLSASDVTTQNDYIVSLTWSNNGQTGMLIEQDTDCDGYETTVYDETAVNAGSPYWVGGLTEDTCYKFRISSYNSEGTINTVSRPETSEVTTPPAQPIGLSVVSTGRSEVTLDWDDVVGATDYYIYDSDDNYLAAPGSATSGMEVQSLSANTQYTLYVRAVNSNGEGIASSTVSTYTKANMPVSLGHSSQATDSMRWTWLSGGTQQDFYAYCENPVANSGYTTNLYWDQSTLSSNISYQFYVYARNQNDEIADGDLVSSWASFYTSQTTPTGITALTTTSTSLRLQADGSYPSLDQGSSGLYFSNDTTESNSGWLQTAIWENSGLDANTLYTYSVKARNGDGDETVETEASFYTAQITPTELNDIEVGTSNIIVEAQGDFVDLTEGISGLYFENITTEQNSGWVQQITWSQQGLTPGQTYEFRVKARNFLGVETAYSDTLEVVTLDPDSVTLTGLSEEEALTSVTVTAVGDFSNLSQGQVGLYFENVTTAENSGWVQETSWIDDELTQRTTYEFRVKARNSIGVEGSFLDAIEATTLSSGGIGSEPTGTIGDGDDGGDGDGDSDDGDGDGDDQGEDEAEVVDPVYQCSDGLDNDSDGDIDLDDPGCSSTTDNDESDEDELRLSSPDIEEPLVITSNSITWQFTDRARGESGFGLKDVDNEVITLVEGEDLTTIVEEELTPNTAYQRRVFAYAADVTGSGSSLSDIVYTLAQNPEVKNVSVVDSETVNLEIDTQDNPDHTKYSIYEKNTEKWVQEDSELGRRKISKTYTDWVGEGSVVSIFGLSQGEVYDFQVQALNGDGVSTDLSEEFEVIAGEIQEPDLLVSKRVGINLKEEVAQKVIFGDLVLASGLEDKIIKTLPVASLLLNRYFMFTGLLLLFFLVSLVLNIAAESIKGKLIHLRHAPKIVLTDWRSRKVDHYYELMHSDQPKRGIRYHRHRQFYNYTGWAALGLVVGVVAKLVIIAVTVALIYCYVPVFAIDNQSGEEVHVGAVLTYQVEVENRGDGRATDLSIIDSLPDNSTYILDSIKIDGLGVTDRARDDQGSLVGRNIIANFEYLDPEETAILEFKVKAGEKEDAVIRNVAYANYADSEKSYTSNVVSNVIAGRTRCNDRLDNDKDGFVDYPDDPGCTSLADKTENTDLFPQRGARLKKLIKPKALLYWLKGAELLFNKGEQEHKIKIKSIDPETGKVIFTVESDPIDVEVGVGGSQQIDIDGDGIPDIEINLEEIYSEDELYFGVEDLSIEATCGDAVCSGDETCNTCESDCGVCEEEEVLPVCGDNQCNGEETCDTCESDCGVCEEEEVLPVCGDNQCNGEETCTTCVGDCGICPALPVCGDNQCNGEETCTTCESDCGACVVEGDESGEEGENAVDEEDEEIDEEEANIIEDIIDEEEAEDVAGGNEDEEKKQKIVEAKDALDNIEKGEDLSVEQAVAIIEVLGGSVDEEENDDKFAQQSEALANIVNEPQVVKIVKEIDKKNEWDKTKSERELELVYETEKIVQSKTLNSTTGTLAKVVSKVTGMTKKRAQVETEKTIRKTVKTTKIVQKSTIDNPTVEKVNYLVKTPTVSTVTATSIASVATAGATSATGASALTYLQFMFTQPLLLFVRRRKQGWGVIYNAASKQPVDLAIVRVYSSETKRLVGTKVTDKQGRYEFILNSGKYYMEVSKKGFLYPCKILDHKEHDDVFNDIYYGEEFEVHERDAVSWPIPLDPVQQLKTNSVERKTYWRRRLQLILTGFAPMVALISIIISPTWKMGALFIAQIALYFLFNRLARGDKPKSWGVIKDSERKAPLSRAVVRVFDTKFNKLLETQVTDHKGRYAFLVGNQEYYLTADKPGFYNKRSSIFNLRGSKTGYLAETMALRPHKLGPGVDNAQKNDQPITVRTDLGRQSEKVVDGKQKVVRRDEEKFEKELKEVDVSEMHEDYYNLDTLS
jgi:uncharacterized repeat protein (TIGR01451 family)